MDLHQLGYVAASAVICSFFAGLMGIGGGVLMAPLLLAAPSIVPGLIFPLALVTGITASQDLVGSLSAAIAHRRYKLQNRTLLLYMCSIVFLAALVGSTASEYARPEIVLAVLAFLVTMGALGMLALDLKKEAAGAQDTDFPKLRTVLVSIFIGLLAGFVGQGSAFILIPAMLLILRLPLPVTIANSLGIVFCAALGGLLGRWGTRQISLEWLLVLAVAAIPGAVAGTYVNRRISSRRLEQLMTGLLIAAAVELWWKMFPLQDQ